MSPMMSDQRCGRQLTTWDELAIQRPLPIQFAIFPSRRVNHALCPALVLRTDGVEVIRILDPEHKQPFFSLDGLFLLAGLTVPAGLVRFGLHRDRGDYDLTLAGLEPREAIWSPWSTAYAVAEQLQLLPAVKALFSCKHAWSLDEGKEGFSHNWCVSSEQVDPSSYSLTALLDQPFTTITLLPRRQQIRTLMSDEQRARAVVDVAPIALRLDCGNAGEAGLSVRQRHLRTEQSLLRWAVRAYDQWCEAQSEQSRSQQEDSDGAQQIQPAWTPSHADILLLLRDVLPIAPGDDDGASDQPSDLSLNGGHASMPYEELKAWQIRGHTDEMHSQQYLTSEVDRKVAAHTCLHLVDHLCRLYVDRAVLCARQHIKLVVDHSTAAGGLVSAVDNDQQDAKDEPSASTARPPPPIDARLSRLEASAKRTESALAQLLRRDADVSRRKPVTIGALDLGDMTWQRIVALLIGILIGSLLVQGSY